jgi:predicted RNA binding protein YcfA (HicA-like mRNA interferase family)
MGKTEKLLDKARRNPAGLSFTDFQTLLQRCRWQCERHSGSHAIFYSPKGARLPIQPRKSGKAKAYQVKQFLERYDDEQSG